MHLQPALKFSDAVLMKYTFKEMIKSNQDNKTGEIKKNNKNHSVNLREELSE